MRINVGDVGADYVKLTPAIKDWLRQNGARFVARYAVPEHTTKIGKVITRDEIRWLHENGIGIFLNFEINHQDADKGYDFGFRNGQWLRQFAADLKYPDNVPLFVSVDTDTWKGNIVAHRDYVEGFAAAIRPYRVGIYGDDDIAWACRALNPVIWLANAKAWSNPLNPNVAVTFRQGSPVSPGVDPNYCLREIEAWGPVTLKPETGNVVHCNARLYPGQFIRSLSGWTFWHQHDGNLVLYTPKMEPRWASGTQGRVTSYLTPQGDGNLVLYGPGDVPLWQTHTHGKATTSALVVDTGRVILLGNDWEFLWVRP